jgi:HSP20 family molecular chaperone IbpA
MDKVKFNLLVTTENNPETSVFLTKSLEVSALVPRTGDLVVVDDVAGFRATDVTFNYRSGEVVVAGKMELTGGAEHRRLVEVRDQLVSREWTVVGTLGGLK